MKNQEQELKVRNQIANFVNELCEDREHNDPYLYAVYGFYVSKFHKVCDLSCLGDVLADELVSCDTKTKKSFVDMIAELSDILYDNLGLRVCDTCGCFMTEGYYLDGDYACSEDCAVKNYMKATPDYAEAKSIFEADLEYDEVHCEGRVYWTVWNEM